MNDTPKTARPPIPRPRWQHDADRARELLAAIHAYSGNDDFMQHQDKITFEWFDELHELAVRHLEPQPDYFGDDE